MLSSESSEDPVVSLLFSSTKQQECALEIATPTQRWQADTESIPKLWQFSHGHSCSKGRFETGFNFFFPLFIQRATHEATYRRGVCPFSVSARRDFKSSAQIPVSSLPLSLAGWLAAGRCALTIHFSRLTELTGWTPWSCNPESRDFELFGCSQSVTCSSSSTLQHFFRHPSLPSSPPPRPFATSFTLQRT